MTLVRYNNRAAGPANFTNLVDRFFNDTAFDNTQVEKFHPGVDILESDKAYEIHFAVPGFDKESFNIEVEENNLVVSGERKFEKADENIKYKTVQTSYGTFRRSFILPDYVDRAKIDAKYNNGILEVVIPKDEAKTIKTTVKVK